MNPAGFWFIVKAAMLAQGAGQQQILDYGKKKYIRYHNSEDGWDDIVARRRLRRASCRRPALRLPQYRPPSPAEQAADLVKTKSPTQMSFAEWELVLSSGNQQAADTVWNAIKGKAVKLGANVISATASSVQLAGSDDDIDAKKADITLTMEKPITVAADAGGWCADELPGNGGDLYAQSVHDEHDRRHTAGQERKSAIDHACGPPPRPTNRSSRMATRMTGSGQRRSHFLRLKGVLIPRCTNSEFALDAGPGDAERARNARGCSSSARLFFDGESMGAARRTAPSVAQGFGVELELGNSAAEGVAVHAELAGSLALVPVAVLQDRENELLLEFADGFGIGNTASVHVHNQSFQLIFHDASLR
jgi:hypothetical protein